VCAVANRFGLPVLYDVMGDIAAIELYATEYPAVAFVVPHLGSFADDWAAQRAFLDLLARHPNVYTDTSGVRRFDLLVEAVRRGGARKVLFGTDGPWLHPAVELAKVRALGLPDHLERLVLGGNLRRLISRVRLPGGPIPTPDSGVGELPAGTDPWVPRDDASSDRRRR
jgi:predicted TIM-barrel fold metal-dependent hydrolase